jgi:hypothetical protein
MLAAFQASCATSQRGAACRVGQQGTAAAFALRRRQHAGQAAVCGAGPVAAANAIGVLAGGVRHDFAVGSLADDEQFVVLGDEDQRPLFRGSEMTTSDSAHSYPS